MVEAGKHQAFVESCAKAGGIPDIRDFSIKGEV